MVSNCYVIKVVSASEWPFFSASIRNLVDRIFSKIKIKNNRSKTKFKLGVARERGVIPTSATRPHFWFRYPGPHFAGLQLSPRPSATGPPLKCRLSGVIFSCRLWREREAWDHCEGPVWQEAALQVQHSTLLSCMTTYVNCSLDRCHTLFQRYLEYERRGFAFEYKYSLVGRDRSL